MVLRPAFSIGIYYLINSVAMNTEKNLNVLLYYEIYHIDLFIENLPHAHYTRAVFLEQLSTVEMALVHKSFNSCNCWPSD